MLEIEAKRFDFQKELSLIQTVVERRHTIPILANVLIEAQGDRVRLSATDLDVSLRTVVKAEVFEGGSLTVQARKLHDIMRTLSEEQVHFRAEENRLTLTCGRSRFRLTTLPVENFPEVPALRKAALTLPSETLKTMIERTTFATTHEESRYALSGVQMEYSGASLRMVATDGHRLALCEKMLTSDDEKGPTVEPFRVLVPRKTMVELARLITSEEENGKLQFDKDENHVYFRLGERELTSRLLTGQFPNYEMVIPKEQPITATVNAEAFTSALRRVALIADERSRGVKLSFSDGRVELSTRRIDEDEEAEEDLLCDYSAEHLEIAFNSSYLLDFFEVVRSGDVRVGLKDSQSPALLTPAEDDYTYKYVVMPMRMV